MIVLAVGMPRAGSGWHYNLVHDLVVANGGVDARQIRQRYHLGRILTEINCNIGALTSKRLLPVMVPSLLGNTFAIKAHAGPKPLALRLISNGYIRPTYIYRDPRAALLSAYEYGQRGLEGGRANAFSHLTTVEKAIDFMLEYVAIWQAWMNVEKAHTLRYEDLLSNYDAEVTHLLDYLAVTNPDAPKVQAIIEQYRPGQVSKSDKGLHFHKGQAERFRTALTAEQLEKANEAFGGDLQKMGYSI
ncbi:MAG: hypothetical protein DWQ07_19760 [Chloroflexi bacterium]|nr:MAG: hypothetical protein DWQ07_19760 [Chloroflexota bacterium]MBL1194320.1 hypothetical protein [Chloroflexota bacterium]NOH11610.1 hypothetical protein [Chloroflexota bacterium]